MNIQSNSVSFKGIYIVTGKTEDVKNAKDIVKNRVPLSTVRIDCEDNRSAAIFATDEDSITLTKSKRKHPELLELDQKKTLKSNIYSILKKIFPHKDDLKQTKIAYADDIIEYDKKDDEYQYFHYSTGHIAGKESLCLDGNRRTYFANGKVAACTKKDGTLEEYYSDGTIYRTLSTDGHEIIYNEDGFVRIEKQPDGRTIEYYSNGGIRRAIDAEGKETTYYVDGSIKKRPTTNGGCEEYYENGTIKRVTDAKGNSITYNRNGDIISRISADGTGKEYDGNGNLISESHSDGSKTEYYPNGRRKTTISPDLTVKSYYENGRLESVINPDNTAYRFNDKGNLTVKRDYKGLYHTYSYGEDGLVESEVISNGIINRFSKGQWVSKQKSDGTIFTFAPYNGERKEIPIDEIIPGYTTLRGYIMNVTSPDGSKRYYDEDGNLTATKSADGKYRQHIN